MKSFAYRLTLLACAAFGASDAPAAQAADTIAPSAIVADPASYEGKPVSVSGTVAKYQTAKTMMGTIAAFTVCDAKCVVVIDETNTAHKDGDTVTVTGTFQSTFKGRQRTFTNVVVIK